jgi:hypothetical protein
MDIINRDDLERKLARILGRDMRAELSKLLTYLGDPPRLANVPMDYWSNGWREIQKDVEPALIGIFLQQARAFMDDIGIGVNWDQINIGASNWARRHTEQMLMDLFGTRYERLNELIPRFYEEDWSIATLSKELGRYYDPVRAEMIAVTETTRAAVEGELEVMREIEKDNGISMVAIWLTANDERVCAICNPMNGEKEAGRGGDGKPFFIHPESGARLRPPAHPRCRCGIALTFAEVQA